MWPSSKSESLPIGQEEDKLLRSAVQNSLKIADTLQLTSISLPAISSGIFGYPKPRCARVLFDAVIDYVNSNATTLTEIRFTNFDDKTVDLFEEECKKR
jgi:O-acetyl-ADP-ribose deacetylase (regulator of RNase III)